MFHIRARRVLGVAAVAASALLFVAGPANADLGDTVGGTVGTTTDQVKSTVDPVVTKVVEPATQPVVKPVVKAVVKPVVQPVVKAVVQPVEQTVTQVRQQVASPAAGSGGTAPVQSTAPRSAPSSAQPSAPDAVTRPGTSGARSSAARAANARTARSSTGVHAARSEQAPVVHLALTLNRPPVSDLVPLAAPAATRVSGSATSGDVQLPQGCMSSSLALDELRRCALADVLGETGGFWRGVLPAGLALVLSGYFVISVSRRRVLRAAPASARCA